MGLEDKKNKPRQNPKGSHPSLLPEEYYYSAQGFIVFTEEYHLKRGYCCKSQCRHCPYENKKINAPL